VGSFPRQRLSDEEICQRYRDGGESQGMIGLRARLSCAQVRAVLEANNIRIRQSAEALRLSLRTRPPRASTERARERKRC
jgi:hypothetical protein